MESMDPETGTEYISKEYWDQRYDSSETSYDW